MWFVETRVVAQQINFWRIFGIPFWFFLKNLIQKFKLYLQCHWYCPLIPSYSIQMLCQSPWNKMWIFIFLCNFGTILELIWCNFSVIFLPFSNKLGCVVSMVVVSMVAILPHAECGPNDHRKDAPPFIWYNF